MNIDIPFQSDFEDKMLAGIKICTSRYKRYGKVSDTFKAFGATFEIVDVQRHPLYVVANLLHLPEGFDTVHDFWKCWWRLHPRRKRDYEQLVWTHWFAKREES